ncbi:MAG: pantothenate kinase [Oscillospiraceae bacterium]|jgi:type II pantothenate kinase|nr:pantothenate kinase [Oscillospiraceae bacterium]
MIQLGVDVGGSTTKIAGVDSNGRTVATLQVRAADQATSMYGAVGRFLHENRLSLSDIERVSLTGVGASFFSGELYGIPVEKVSEFESIGLGALQLSGLTRVIAASVGTGTAFIRATERGATRLGGTGVGGGTLLGLSSLLLSEEDVGRVSELSALGDPANVDLLMGVISAEDIPALPRFATAANFGNVNPTTRREDLARGVTNLIAQTIGMMAVFLTRNDPDGISDVVLVGSVSNLPQFADVMAAISAMTGVRFTIPENATFATAFGALSLSRAQSTGSHR